MCGIAGYISTDLLTDEMARVKEMCSFMQHRGPDALQTEEKETVCFGHARLSIIDLDERSNQPMWNSNKTVLLVMNGEIYNFKELKSSLNTYSFQTESDTEVVLAAYERWGEFFLEHLDGMFSLALYDSAKNETFLARDPLGKKPLYHYKSQNGLWFSSEIRALFKAKICAPKINKEALSYYLQYQTVHFPKTIIKDVLQIPPGSYLKVKEGIVHEFSYLKNKKVEAGDSVKSLFTKAVQKRLVSDVPLAVLLSAGIDSNLILSAATKAQKIDAFTIGFEEKEFDESELAAESAKHYGAKHHVVKLKESDFLDSIDETLKSMDHPSGDGPNTYMISKEIKNAGFTVALSGLGGDELFYGYPHYQRYMQLKNSFAYQLIPQTVLNGLSKLYTCTDTQKLTALKKELDSPERSMAIFRSNFTADILQKVFGVEEDTFSEIDEPDSILNKISKTEMAYYMHDILLRDADQMSMAHSLELRNPFLDYSLVQHVWNIKNKKAIPPKNILLNEFKNELPKSILNKKKTGFTFPWNKWMRGSLNSFCAMQMEFLEQTQLFKKGSINTIWKEFNKGSKTFTWSRIWPLVSLAFWIKENKVEY